MTEESPELIAALGIVARVYGAPDPASAIRQACAELLEKVGYEAGRPHLDRVVEAVEARVSRRHIPVSGLLRVEPDHYEIELSASESRNRQRFSLGHEIGHILVLEAVAEEPGALQGVLQTHSSRMLERLCDLAASELFLPMVDFCRKLSAGPLTYEGVAALARFYEMSLDAVLVRVTQALPGVGVSLLRRETSYSHARPLGTRSYGRDRGLRLPPVIGETAFRPPLMRRALVGGGRSVTRSLAIEWPGFRLREVDALLLARPPRPPTRRTVDQRGQSLRATDADFLLFIHRNGQPSAAWSDITGRARQAARAEKVPN